MILADGIGRGLRTGPAPGRSQASGASLARRAGFRRSMDGPAPQRPSADFRGRDQKCETWIRPKANWPETVRFGKPRRIRVSERMTRRRSASHACADQTATVSWGALMTGSPNLASRAARWSEAHHKAVVLGWLAFVFVTIAFGSATGMVTLMQMQTEDGRSRVADEIQARESPRERSGEEVVIESRSGRSLAVITARRWLIS
jgi:hypothetical protein